MRPAGVGKAGRCPDPPMSGSIGAYSGRVHGDRATEERAAGLHPTVASSRSSGARFGASECGFEVIETFQCRDPCAASKRSCVDDPSGSDLTRTCDTETPSLPSNVSSVRCTVGASPAIAITSHAPESKETRACLPNRLLAPKTSPVPADPRKTAACPSGTWGKWFAAIQWRKPAGSPAKLMQERTNRPATCSASRSGAATCAAGGLQPAMDTARSAATMLDLGITSQELSQGTLASIADPLYCA